MKRIIACAMVALLTAVLLAGCAKKEEKPAETQAGFKPALDTQQTASFSIVGHLDNFEALEAVINEFGKIYPNVTIAYEKLGDYNNMLTTRLENDPNVGCFLDGGSALGEDLSPYGVDISAFGEVINAGIIDGKLYSIPLGIDVRGMVVNVTLLEKEGLKVPTNYGEFISVCDALVKKGYTPIQQKGREVTSDIFQNYLWHIIDTAEDFHALIAEMSTGNKGCFDSVRPMFDMLTSFIEKGYTSREINEALADNYNAAILNFFEGNVAFLPANVDTVSGMAKREIKSEAFTAHPFTYRFIYAPLSADGIYADQRAWRTLSVNRNCANKELAVEFIRFMAMKDNLNLLAKVKGIPSAANEQTDERFSNINDAKGHYIHSWNYKVDTKLTNSIIGRLGEYCAGEFATVDEAIAALENDLKEYHK